MPERKLMLAHAAHYKVGKQSKMIHSASGVTHAHSCAHIHKNKHKHTWMNTSMHA